MVWNYRVIHRVYRPDALISEEEHEYRICEVYYADEDATVLEAWAATGAIAQGSDMDELRDDLKRIERALELPILEYDDMPGIREVQEDGG